MNTTTITVQVLGPGGMPADDAIVMVRTIAGEVALSPVGGKGRYTDEVRLGPAVVTVNRAPFETDVRSVTIRDGGAWDRRPDALSKPATHLDPGP
ncbi:MAG: hypothetical protein AAFN05_09970 [Pseudomonadota bacterium]